MTSQIKIVALLFVIMALLACGSNTNEQTAEHKQELSVTIRKNGKDSTFTLNSMDSPEKYMTELWVSDPECTECKDCYVDSGEIKIPEVLKQYIKQNKDLYLTCKNPYEIENTAYIQYKLKGHVTGVKRGCLLFCVTEWERQ